MLEASESGDPVLVEATSNQVDQTGGYTGMRPADFRDLVLGIAAQCGLPSDRVVLGGDHLGPNRWRDLPPDAAMDRAVELVSAYVAAGFTKIHVDCTFACAGDREPLSDEVVSARAARLIAAAERTAVDAEVRGPIQYVIGTEVPTPGGEREPIETIIPTSAVAARRTLAAHREALHAHGLSDVWPRVIALVVQPGVDFDHLSVVDYTRWRTAELRAVLDGEPDMVFEAHSTDYQTAEGLRALVEDHWAILKVGPGLTFALREALFALAAIEHELVAGRRSQLREVIESRMLGVAGALGALLRRRCPQPAPGPALQLQRSPALLLARPGCARCAGASARQPERRADPASAAEPVPADPIPASAPRHTRRRPACARARSHPRCTARLRRGVPTVRGVTPRLRGQRPA